MGASNLLPTTAAVCIIVDVLIVISNVDANYSELALSGPGVCFENVTQDVMIPVITSETFNVTSQYFCFAIPPWCDQTTNHTITKNTFQALKQTFTINTCCSGFQLDKSNKSCLPVCSENCEVEGCIGPDECIQCIPGFIGQQCTPTCPYGTYGHNCTLNCSCVNANYYCNPVYGCVCKNGYTGQYCQISLKSASITPTQLIIGIAVVCTFIIFMGYVVDKLLGRSRWYSNEKTPLIADKTPAT